MLSCVNVIGDHGGDLEEESGVLGVHRRLFTFDPDFSALFKSFAPNALVAQDAVGRGFSMAMTAFPVNGRMQERRSHFSRGTWCSVDFADVL